MKQTKLIFRDQINQEAKNEWLSKEERDCEHAYHIPGVNTQIPLGFTNPKPIAVDIGVNVGAFCTYSSFYFDKIWGFEAAKNTYNVAKENTSRHKNVKLYNLAVSSDDDQILHLASHESGLSGDTSIFNIKQDETIPTEQCKTISLDSIYSKCGINYIDYLKIDCEGSEYDFLMNKDLSQINFLVIEIHPGYVGVKKTLELLLYLDKYFAFLYPVGEHILFYQSWKHYAS
jgi:FkbM family methyltransferase